MAISSILTLRTNLPLEILNEGSKHETAQVVQKVQRFLWRIEDTEPKEAAKYVPQIGVGKVRGRVGNANFLLPLCSKRIFCASNLFETGEIRLH